MPRGEAGRRRGLHGRHRYFNTEITHSLTYVSALPGGGRGTSTQTHYNRAAFQATHTLSAASAHFANASTCEVQASGPAALSV